MIPSDTTDLITAQSTHEGEVGKNNEDRAVVGAFRESSGSEVVTLAMVADGIGGHAAGEIASDLAVRTVYDYMGQASTRDPLGVLQAALLAANEAIYHRSRSEPQLQGMGSTAVVAVIVGRRLYAAHVGDSRMYLIRDGQIRQLTVDHTWVQEAISAGLLTPEDARKHPNRHVIRRYLGHDLDTNPVDLGIQTTVGETAEQMARNQGLTLRDGDMLLMCSDGLTDLVEDDEIRAAVLELPPQEATEQLVLLARQRGGFDNITVVLVKAPARPGAKKSGSASATQLVVPRPPAAAPAPTPKPRPKRRNRSLLYGVIGIVVLLLLIAAGGIAGLFFLNRSQDAPAALPTAPAAAATAPEATVGAALPPGNENPSGAPASETPPPTDTAAPTEAPSETPAPQPFVTLDSEAPIRVSPDPNASVLATLLPGATADVYGRDPSGRWLFIEYPPGTASRGWIFRAATTLTGSIDDIPLLNDQGTPLPGQDAPAEGAATPTPQG